MVHLLLLLIYLSFISLGLPDGLLGAGWPSMYVQFGVPVSYAGAVSVIIAMGTVISSLLSDRITRKLGAGRVTAISVAITAVALLGFSASNAYWMLLLWAIPYGLGAGSVDAALNNYVALHYSSRHMSWLHCMWGIGASTGPCIMGWVLTGGGIWNTGYRIVGVLQLVLTLILVLSLPVWRIHARRQDGDAAKGEAKSLRQVLAIPGAKEILIAFFCYSAVEQTAALWSATYLVEYVGLAPELAAGLASLFFVGITVGRGISGFLTVRFADKTMIRLGQGLVLTSVALMLLPLGAGMKMVGLILLGFGCAPIYPCVIHSTPAHFGAENSQALIGVQMACAYLGTVLMPPLFGLIANHIHIGLFTAYLLLWAVVMTVMCEKLNRK